VTAQCEIATTPAAVAMFDQLVVNDGVPKVVDIGEAWYWRFFSLCEEVGFVEETRRRGFELVILFPAEANAAASLAYDKLRRQLSRVLVVAVLNEAILQGRKVRDHYPFVRSAAVPLQIPTLPPALKTHAERSALTFTEFHAKLPMSVPMGHAYELRSWTKRAFLEFREFELRLLLEKLQQSLRG